ncbi:MAG TPA: DUF1579 family protein [Gemmatimonadales bacterium]
MQRMAKAMLAIVPLCVALAPAVAGQAAPPQKPGPEHQRLGFFVGKWKVEGEVKPGPMGPGGKLTGTDNCEWFEGQFTVICRSESRGPSGPSKSIGLLGYSPEEKAYTYYGVDNSSMTMSTVPKGHVEGKTWTYTDESTMGGQKVKSRVTLVEESPTAYTFRMEFEGPDGKWMQVMSSRNTKVQ